MSRNPTPLRRQLGRELAIARGAERVNQRDLANVLGIHQTTIARIEAGTARVPSRAMVHRWLEACQVTREQWDRITALHEAALAETRSYRDMLTDEPGHLQGIARAQETDARLIRSCQMEWIPGLLQTAEYARQFIPQVDPTGQMDHAAAVAARMERQRILYGDGRRFQFIIAEHVLHWTPAPGVMVAQLAHLRTVGTLATVDIRVLPHHRVGAPAWHSFVITEPTDGDPEVTSELLGGYWSATDPETVAQYVTVWENLWEASSPMSS